jgi:hypothetical protein
MTNIAQGAMAGQVLAGTQANYNQQFAQLQQALNQQTAQQQFDINRNIAWQNQFPLNLQTATTQQQQFNLPAAIEQQAMSQYGQWNPYGSLNYVQSGVGPGGVPQYTAVSGFSPEQQRNYLNYTALQGQAGGAANDIFTSAPYASGQSVPSWIGNMTAGQEGQNLAAYMGSVAPFQNIQIQQQMDKLKNQGIDPATNPTAYNNAMMPFIQGIQQANLGAAANYQNQAFQQALTEYQTPWQMAASMGQYAQPTGPQGMFGATPGSQLTPAQMAQTTFGQVTQQPTTIQPPNVIGATGVEQQAFQQAYPYQLQQWSAPWQAGAQMAGEVIGAMLAAKKGGHAPHGKAIIVGEAGPELFIPDSSGTVIPHHELHRLKHKYAQKSPEKIAFEEGGPVIPGVSGFDLDDDWVIKDAELDFVQALLGG